MGGAALPPEPKRDRDPAGLWPRALGHSKKHTRQEQLGRRQKASLPAYVTAVNPQVNARDFALFNKALLTPQQDAGPKDYSSFESLILE